MFTFSYKNFEIIVPERRHRELVERWFDALNDEEAKESIRRVKWNEFKPPLKQFRLIVSCQHPDSEAVHSLSKAISAQKQDEFERTVDQMLDSHSNWVKSHSLPRYATLADRPAQISWWPVEIPLYDRDNLSAQEKGEKELEDQLNDNLSLVYATAQSDKELVKSTVGTNIPFVAAGMMLTGHVRIARRFPEAFPKSQREIDQLHDNILENTTDYLILIRLAAYFGSQLPIVSRVIKVGKDFLKKHAEQIDEWVIEHGLSDSEDYDGSLTWSTLEAACDEYRREMLKATLGYEDELSKAINSFLKDFPIPESPFPQNLEDE